MEPLTTRGPRSTETTATEPAHRRAASAARSRPAARDSDKLLHFLVRRTGELLEADGAAVVVATPDGFRIVEATGGLQPLRGRFWPALGAAVEEVLRSNETLIFDDVEGSGWDASPFGELTDAVRALSVPACSVGRRHVALVAVAGRRRDPFSGADAQLVTALAGQAAPALESLLLHDELAERDAAIARLETELQRARRVRGSFLACSSHELRTPLNAILCYTDLLAMGALGALNDRQLRALERTARAVRQLRRVIEDLFELAELEAERPRFTPAIVDPCELVEEVLAELEPSAHERGLRLTLESTCPRRAAPRTVETDAGRLRRLLLLLGEFCLTFTDRGTVSVRVRFAESGARIEFDGAGPQGRVNSRPLDLEQLAALRPDGTRAGIGMLIARRLAQYLGARVGLENGKNEAAALVLRVPPRLPTHEANTHAEVAIVQEAQRPARSDQSAKQRAGG